MFVNFLQELILCPLVIGFIEEWNFVLAFVHIRISKFVNFIHIVVRGVDPLKAIRWARCVIVAWYIIINFAIGCQIVFVAPGHLRTWRLLRVPCMWRLPRRILLSCLWHSQWRFSVWASSFTTFLHAFLWWKFFWNIVFAIVDWSVLGGFTTSSTLSALFLFSLDQFSVIFAAIESTGEQTLGYFLLFGTTVNVWAKLTWVLRSMVCYLPLVHLKCIRLNTCRFRPVRTSKHVFDFILI